MGWLGPDALAAGALGTNLYFAFLIFGIGLVTATAPMIAQELGRNRHSVREVRRTVRQGLWAAVADRRADLDRALARRGDPRSRSARSPALARGAGAYIRALQWACCPSCATSCCARSWRRWSGRSGRWCIGLIASRSTPPPPGC